MFNKNKNDKSTWFEELENIIGTILDSFAPLVYAHIPPSAVHINFTVDTESKSNPYIELNGLIDKSETF